MDLDDILMFILITALSIEMIHANEDTQHISSACYGTSSNYLELSCLPGEVISVTKVQYGAKLKADECPNPTTNNEHPPSCCYLTPTDCVILPPAGSPDPYLKQCTGQEACRMQTRWMDTQGKCSEDHLTHTNFMELTYICLSRNINQTNAVASRPSSTTPASPSPPPTTTTSSSTSASPVSTSTTTTTQSTSSTTSTTTTPSTAGQRAPTTREDPQPRAMMIPGSSSTTPILGSHVELDVSFTSPHSTTGAVEEETSSFAFTTGMMGGMTAAIVGLMLTIFGFLFYWGRRKRKLTTTKPNNSTVWDFLLAHTVAARTFRRGYDNFSNNRESVSSEGDLGLGKQTWLPNIRVEPNIDTQSVTSDENCSIVNISTLGSGNNTISSRNDRSEA